jgi:chemotaxis protein MotA
MNLIIGAIAVVVCTLGGYVAMGGKLMVLWQPFELVIIFGSACGAYVTANSSHVLKITLGSFGKVMKGPKYKREHFVELLTLQYQVFKVAKTRGLLALEQHIEKPKESSLFAQFPLFFNEEHALTFLCDYLRLMTLGSDNPHELEALMEEEIEVHHHEAMEVAGALQTMSDGLPALGIVAAVLGVIKTMGSITEPPEVLGGMIGGALVGTFLGVFLAYGIVGPLAARLGDVVNEEGAFYRIIQSVLVAHLHGNAAQISVEIGRGSVPSGAQPSFLELEEALSAIPNDA